jgi:tetratricopeptide (TPR) repeat protein
VKGKKNNKQKWLSFLIPKDDLINPESFGKIDYLCGLLVLFISFGVYLWTMAPTVNFGDSGDFISSAYTLGLPHPTGYSAYILLAHLISYLPIGNIAFRINLLSSFFASLAVMMAYFITRKVTFFNHEGLKGRKNPQITQITLDFKKIQFIIPSVVAALILAFSPVFWSQAVIAEVYTLHIFFLLLMILALLEANFLIFAFIFGLSLTNHLTSILILPTLAWWLVIKRGTLSFKKISLAGVFFLLGLLPYLYLPIRSLMHPTLDWANPITIERFIYYVTGRQYQYLISSGQQVTSAFLDWFIWWKGQFTPYIGIIGLGGIGFLIIHRLNIAILILLVFLSNLFFSLLYRTAGVDQEIYYMPSFAIWVIFMGCGIKLILNRLKNRIAILSFSLTFLILPIIFLLINWQENNKSRYYFAYDYGADILRELPFQSIVFLQADGDMFPLWYHRYIEKKRLDISPIHTKYIGKPWYLERIKKENPQVKMEPLEASNTYQIFRDLVNENIDNLGLYLTFNDDPMLSAIKEKPVNQGILFSLNRKGGIILDYQNRNLFNSKIFQDSWVKANMRAYANAYYQKASEYVNLGNHRRAVWAFKTAEKIQPEFVDVDFLSNIGRSYYFLGEYNNAISTYKRSLLLNSENLDTHNTLGICYYYLGKTDKAIFHLKEALRINPNDSSALSNLNLILELKK